METKTYPPNTSANSFGKHCTFGRVQHFVTLWTVAHQAPLSMGFSKQEYWVRCRLPTPRDLPDPGTELMSLVCSALAGRLFTTVPPGEPPDPACLPPTGHCPGTTLLIFHISWRLPLWEENLPFLLALLSFFLPHSCSLKVSLSFQMFFSFTC